MIAAYVASFVIGAVFVAQTVFFYRCQGTIRNVAIAAMTSLGVIAASFIFAVVIKLVIS